MMNTVNMRAKVIVGLPPRLTSFENVGSTNKISLEEKKAFFSVISFANPDVMVLIAKILHIMKIVIQFGWEYSCMKTHGWILAYNVIF